MNATSTVKLITTQAVLSEPLAIIEPDTRSVEQVLTRFLIDIEKHAEPVSGKQAFDSWFSKLVGDSNVAFCIGAFSNAASNYGVYMLSFGDGPHLSNTPAVTNIIRINTPAYQGARIDQYGPLNENGAISSDYLARYLVVESLLFLGTPSDMAAKIMRATHKDILESQFFDGGVGELLTIGTFRFMPKADGVYGSYNERKFTGTFGADRIFIDPNLSIRSEDYVTSITATQRQINEQIRAQMKAKSDVWIGMKQDIRRCIQCIGVNQNKRAELEQTFIRELRAMKAR